MRLAAVDIGTNTVRLLVADVREDALVDVVRDREITRLGQGVDEQRRLDADAIARTVRAASSFVERARAEGAEVVRVAGTSALRDAADRERFAAALRDAVGAELELLSGRDEGRLSYLGATAGLSAGDYIVCDIGGGSTEFSTAETAVSVDIGSVRLTEKFLRTQPPTASEVDAARGFVTNAIDVVVVESASLVGVAGTSTTLAALVLGLQSYDRDAVHHATLERGDVAAWSERLLRLTPPEIVALGPVEPGRADVVGAGVLILLLAMEHLGADQVLVSETDILDGLVLDLAERLA